MRKVEQVLDSHTLLRRYHLRPKKNHFINNRIHPAVFWGADPGVPDPDCSVFVKEFMKDENEWFGPKVPGNMGLIGFLAQAVRDGGAEVEHTPNLVIDGERVPYSHASIYGLTPALCAQLIAQCWLLDVEPSPFQRSK